jgi:hypothetical protein
MFPIVPSPSREGGYIPGVGAGTALAEMSPATFQVPPDFWYTVT